MNSSHTTRIWHTIVGIVIVSAIGLGVYTMMRDSATSLHTDIVTDVPTVEKQAPVIEVRSFTKKTSDMDIRVEYAELVYSTSSTTSFEKVINERLRQEAEKIYTEQLKEFSSYTTPESLAWGQRSVIYERKVEKDRVYVDAQVSLISLIYTNYIDTGGAHGTFFYSSDAIDLNSGKDIVLADLLEGIYEPVVLGELRNQIETSSSTETCVHCYAEFTGQDIDMFISEHFALTQKGITFLYGAYDLGAYALTSAGQEITVSKAVLEGFVSRVW